MKFALSLLFVVLTKISFCTLIKSNSTFRINSENALYSLISIPKTKFDPGVGETIIIDNKTQKLIWKIDEYLNDGYRIYLSNDGMNIFLLNDFLYMDYIPSNPIIIQKISCSDIRKSYTYKELFDNELKRTNDIMPAISGFFKTGDSLTILSLDDTKVVIDLKTFNKSNQSKAKKIDIEKSNNETKRNEFIELESQEIRLQNKNTSFFDELLKELKRYYDVNETTDKENFEVAIYLTLNVVNGHVEIWESDVAIKSTQSSFGYKIDDEVRQKVEDYLKSLLYDTENPFNASNWIYTLKYYLK